MTVRDELIESLWFGRDPFVDFPASEHPVDHQGWNSDHPYLGQAIREARPRIVVEVGVWKGGSVLTMAAEAKAQNVDCAIVAVDTWLGSADHWHEEGHAAMRMEHGRSQLFHTFMANVLDRALQDYVVPLPIDSLNALQLLRSRGLRPDVVHIDAGHDYRSATSDITHWWEILADGGLLIGDDYFTDRDLWPEVRRAFDDFVARTPHGGFVHETGKCMLRKPA